MFVVVDGQDFGPIAEESARLMDGASHVVQGDRGHSEALDAYRGRRRHRLCTGERLAELHEGPLLQRHLAAFGRRLLPTRTAYLYFSPGDYVDLHQDAPPCAVTAATCLAGEAPRLLLLPVEGRTPAQVRQWLDAESAERLRARCDSVRLVAGRLVLFEGHLIPHCMAAPAGDVTLATLCFAAVDA